MCCFSGTENHAILEIPRPLPADQHWNALSAAAVPFPAQPRGVTLTVMLGPMYGSYQWAHLWAHPLVYLWAHPWLHLWPAAVPEHAVAARSQGSGYNGPLNLSRR